jgi:hypothetical protein
MAGIIAGRRGAAWIPVRLVISIVVAAAIIAVVFLGLQQANKTSAQSEIEQECDMLAATLSTMVASGDARNVDLPHDPRGDMRTVELSLPEDTSYLGLGVNPAVDGDGHLEDGLTGNGSCIFYRVDGMSERAIWDVGDIKFRQGRKIDGRWMLAQPQQGYVIRGGGKQVITFELVHDSSGNRYVLVLAHDAVAM